MKLHFRTPLLNEEDLPIYYVKEDGTNELNDEGEKKKVMLSETLIRHLKSDIESEHGVKFFSWAIDLFKKGFIDLDKTDTEVLKKFVNSQITVEGGRKIFRFDPQTKYRLLEVFEEAQARPKKKEREPDEIYIAKETDK